jgi:hypothetical protein
MHFDLQIKAIIHPSISTANLNVFFALLLVLALVVPLLLHHCLIYILHPFEIIVGYLCF